MRSNCQNANTTHQNRIGVAANKGAGPQSTRITHYMSLEQLTKGGVACFSFLEATPFQMIGPKDDYFDTITWTRSILAMHRQ